MRCLHCGDCCTRFDIAELNKPAGVRCQHLTAENLCKLWGQENRPEVCRKHDYPADICPIGTQKIRDFNKVI